MCANVFKSQAIDQSEAIFLRHGVRLEDKTGAAGSTNFIYCSVDLPTTPCLDQKVGHFYFHDNFGNSGPILYFFRC